MTLKFIHANSKVTLDFEINIAMVIDMHHSSKITAAIL